MAKKKFTGKIRTDPWEALAESWRRLVTAARATAEAARESCVRCGECCERFSPTLLLPDLVLFEEEVLPWDEVYTLRQGELGTSREGKVLPLKEERLKIRH